MDGRTLEKRYEQVLDEAQCLRIRCRDLEQELRVHGPQLHRAYQRIGRLEQRNHELSDENKVLKRKLADVTAKLKQKPRPAVPAFVKANVADKRSRQPGRRKGHAAALRAAPGKIDVHQEVAAPRDESGKPSCPDCRTQISHVKHHKRVVEDIVPAEVVTTCYHTTRGWCPKCRKWVETRAEEQPPAADLPHAQLGLNALSTAMMLRVCYRLPFRQITRLFGQLPGLKISPGAIVKQIRRVGRWMEKQYHRLKLVIRAAEVVHADETGWRTNGKNGYLWALSTSDHTLYHVDRSRGGQVIANLLGQAFGHGGQTLVSDFYSVYDQFNASQPNAGQRLLQRLRPVQRLAAEVPDAPASGTAGDGGTSAGTGRSRVLQAMQACGSGHAAAEEAPGET
jgi:hypothetical protein